jgi:hypothetical protein
MQQACREARGIGSLESIIDVQRKDDDTDESQDEGAGHKHAERSVVTLSDAVANPNTCGESRINNNNNTPHHKHINLRDIQ